MASEGRTDGPESFQHLFPPMAVIKTPEVETPPQLHQQQQRSTNATNSNSSGDLEQVDYVLVFKFPTSSKHRQDEQNKVMNELKRLISKLQRVSLRFQVKPGRTKDTLLILIYCPEDTLYEEFKRERIRDFLLGIRVQGMEKQQDSEDFADEEYQHLTEAERLRIVHEILTGPENEGGASISPNVDPYVESIMPLHNAEFDHAWIRAWSKKWLISRKDLNSIRDHFGEKIAFYFAFVQNYLIWLTAPALLGFLITITGARSLSTWYSLTMLVWSVLFIEAWKRQEKELAATWNVRNCSKHEKRRLEFKGDKTVLDPVTGEEMPYAPIWKIFLRRAMSLPGVAVGAVALALIVAGVIAIQLFLHEYYTGPFHQILHYTPTILYVLFIPTMSNIYSYWVRLLNDWEMHKTESSWEYHYTQKIFIANFLVSYLSLFFIGWIYIPFGEHVLPYLTELNISHEHKKVDFQRLQGQLIYFIVTGQIIGFCTEMLLPYAMNLIMAKVKRLAKKDTNENAAKTAASEGRLLEKIYKQVDRPEYNIYTDYVEMVIQFGYVSMFSTVWPLTALCCIVNNWIELRGDAVKLCKYTRRPVPLRAEGVGPWIGNIETLTWLSSITMASFAYMFHPSTNLHSPYTPIFALLAVLLSEHLYVVVQLVVRGALNAIPSVSDILVRKQEFKMKEVWLNRLRLQKSTGTKRADTGTAGAVTESEAKEQEDEGIRLIQSAFKTE